MVKHADIEEGAVSSCQQLGKPLRDIKLINM
jgi:hypothetical protein